MTLDFSFIAGANPRCIADMMLLCLQLVGTSHTMLSFPLKSVSIRRGLFLNISALMLLLGGGIVVVMFYGTNQQVHTLSKLLVQRTLQQTHADLEAYFTPIKHSLDVLSHWSANGLLNTRQPETMRRLLQPLLEEYPQMSALLIANERGEEYMLLHSGDGWLDRETRVNEWHDKSQVRRWQADAIPQPTLQALHYDPRTRPWFQGAFERLQKTSATTANNLDEQIFWTPPYTFFTTHQPGITAALAHRDQSGAVQIAAIDILLNDISRFTTNMNVSQHGMVFVMTDDGRIVGLPKPLRGTKSTDWTKSLLKTPEALGIPLINLAIKAYQLAPNKHEPFTFEQNGETWWAGTVEFELASYRKLLIGVLAPEQDVIGDIYLIRYGILFILLALIVLTLLRILMLARWYSRPIEALVMDSYRISHGDLGDAKPIATRVKEVQLLAKAHDAMRAGLRNLLRMERDMQLAQQIQQKALPQTLPRIEHFSIAVWNLPADETGGDSYDVLALRKQNDTIYQLDGDEADHAMCMLADAAGHGIGPALSVTQVHSMLRMAARQGLHFPGVLSMLNEQILEDLSGGRFITLWLAVLDARNRRLLSYSAGQAPLLYYNARRKTCEVFEADSPPLGILNPIELHPPRRIDMTSGDFFVVLSDGIYEAVNRFGEAFGFERVVQLIQLNPEQSAEDLLANIRQSLDEFTQLAKPSDDRTAVIIKCL